MWGALHDAARSWAEGVLRVTQAATPTAEQIDAAARGLIGRVTIQDMNRYSALAGEYLRARQNLQQLGETSQIEGTAIFQPPWSTTTGNPAVPTRYRIRVLRSITVRGFTQIQREEWATYEISSPLTTVADALNQANQLFAQADYNSRASINQVLDYSIETV